MPNNPAQQAGAIRALSLEWRQLKDEPLEGFRVRLINEDNLFDWEVAIFGPPGTIYEGGYFKARMRFPQDYHYSPPSLRFEKATLYHPNVYDNGELCISILHAPGDDPHSGELPSERWNPTQSVRTILLSVVSLLNEPNTSSPANVDASVMYRKWKDTNGEEKEYETIVKRQVAASRAEAEKDGVTVPMTLEEYIVKQGPSHSDSNSIELDFYDDDITDDTDMSPNDSQVTASEDVSIVEDPPSSCNIAHPPVNGREGGGGGGETFEEQPPAIDPPPQENQMDVDEPINQNDPVKYRYKLTMNVSFNKKNNPTQN